MLDVMSNGRLIAGMVVGGGPEYFSYQIEPTTAREKFREALDLIFNPFGHLETGAVWRTYTDDKFFQRYCSLRSFIGDSATDSCCRSRELGYCARFIYRQQAPFEEADLAHGQLEKTEVSWSLPHGIGVISKVWPVFHRAGAS